MSHLHRKVAFVLEKRPAAVVPNPARVPYAPRVPRIARLVALAIRFDRLLREGRIRSLGDLARLAHISQPRATQIMNLTLLAPDIIEDLLFLKSVKSGREVIHEPRLRTIAGITDWDEQRRQWRKLQSTIRPD